MIWVFITLTTSHLLTNAQVFPSYEALVKNYSTDKAPKGFIEFCKAHGNHNPNTCAVRMSHALNLTSPNIFKGEKTKSGISWNTLPTRADDLAIILNSRLRKAQLVKTREELAHLKGIVFFDSIPGFNGSGHIALWDGKAFCAGRSDDYFGKSPRIYFWPLK